jgi:GTP-dependent phosphoenolpyruvate carboxykinase
MQIDAKSWGRELASHDALFAKLGSKRPSALATEREKLAERLAV